MRRRADRLRERACSARNPSLGRGLSDPTAGQRSEPLRLRFKRFRFKRSQALLGDATTSAGASLTRLINRFPNEIIGVSMNRQVA